MSLAALHCEIPNRLSNSCISDLRPSACTSSGLDGSSPSAEAGPSSVVFKSATNPSSTTVLEPLSSPATVSSLALDAARDCNSPHNATLFRSVTTSCPMSSRKRTR